MASRSYFEAQEHEAEHMVDIGPHFRSIAGTMAKTGLGLLGGGLLLRGFAHLFDCVAN